MTGFVLQGHKNIKYQDYEKSIFFNNPKYALIGKHLL